MNSLTLSPDELRELTGMTRYSAQARALAAMGIPFRRRPDGTLAVLREEILTGQRVNDVLSLRLASIREDGIHFRQQKTDAKLVVAWTPELRDTVDRAKKLIRGVSGFTLLQGRRGKPADYRSIVVSWRSACKAAGVADAQLRDIRAMAATATRAQGGNATALLGHKSKAMTDRYLRDKAVPVVSGPSFVVPMKRKDSAQ